MTRPESEEHPTYFSKYINLIDDIDPIFLLKEQMADVSQFFNEIPENLHEFRYAPGKWSIKQAFLHIIDTERVMVFRALVAARGDYLSPIPGMNENLYAENADASDRTMNSLLEEFVNVRLATISLVEPISDEVSKRRALISGANTSVRALVYIILGHVIHHQSVIKERYL